LDRPYSVRRPVLALVAGALVGTLGGLIGLGGAEFRLPVLITLFALYAHRAVRFNLLVSLVTLAVAAVTRLELQPGIDLSAYLDVVVSMIAGGVISAWIGAGLLARIPASRLMQIISTLLLVVAVMLFAEATYQGASLPTLPNDTALRVGAGLFAGLCVGAISSLLGVAGGEFIIPILIFIFGADIKTAGTLSLLISLPVVAVGVAKHTLTGHYRSRDVLLYLVLPMSLGSVIGAIAGSVLSNAVPLDALKIALSAILAGSALKLWYHAERG
jgi:uncharacterized protein